MYWETLPNWIWAIYYAFLLFTLVLAIISIKQSNLKGLSIITIVLIFTTPVIAIINSIGREYGVNEFEHLVTHLQQGSLWALFIIIRYLYIFVWWVLLFFKYQVVKH